MTRIEPIRCNSGAVGSFSPRSLPRLFPGGSPGLCCGDGLTYACNGAPFRPGHEVTVHAQRQPHKWVGLEIVKTDDGYRYYSDEANTKKRARTGRSWRLSAAITSYGQCSHVVPFKWAEGRQVGLLRHEIAAHRRSGVPPRRT